MDKKNTRKSFDPRNGAVYANDGGGLFVCLKSLGDGNAVMKNVASGWTFTAHGCGIYENDSIDWDFSTGGYFA